VVVTIVAFVEGVGGVVFRARNGGGIGESNALRRKVAIGREGRDGIGRGAKGRKGFGRRKIFL
jgi:hypothetical protein